MIWPIPMSEKVYIVTLHKHEDLEEFYNEMESNNFHLVMKRPMSRNTHYMMNEEQAKELRKDPRVWDVQLPPKERGIVIGRDNTNYTPYNLNGTFWKGFDSPGNFTLDSQMKQWGHLHCAGDIVQRAKNQWGLVSEGGTDEHQTSSVDIFSDGKHVDVVICDDPVSIDCQEWFSPSTGQTRFKTYDWYTELNTIVGTIDDDFQSIPSAPYSNYFDNATNTESHGTHVAGTVAGQFYGWAREANIYSLQVLDNQANTGSSVPDLLIFDYLRAFHQNKAINPATGFRNPTITNHSWSYGLPLDEILEKETLDLSDIIQITYRGIVYNSGNPNPSGWTWAGLEQDFGFAPNKVRLNVENTSTIADIEDAISDGVIVVAAAGNNNFHCVSDGDPDFYNEVVISTVGAHYYNRGSTPANSPNTICVGALSNHADFKRSSYSNFGPNIDVFAPGNNILSAYGNTGIGDSKYGGAPNYYLPIQGTSMASPQVAGVLACLATGKERFTQDSARKYIADHSIYSDMTFDVGGSSGGSAATYNITTTNAGFSYVLNGSDRNGAVSGTYPTVTVNVGDTINFNLSNVQSIHPFRIRDFNLGPDVSTPAASGQGSTGTATVSWTPNTAGNFVYQCGFHSSMRGDIVVNTAPSTTGTFADETCQKDSPNAYLHAKNRRIDLTGNTFAEPIGVRTNGLTFPRVSTFNRSAPGTGQVLTLNVTYSGQSAYIFNGSDRVNTFVNASNPTLNCNANDIIKFNVSLGTYSGSPPYDVHPFHLKTALTPGGADQIPTWINGQNWDGGGTFGGGAIQGEVLLFTFGLAGTTFYYVCSQHISMSGSIIIS